MGDAVSLGRGVALVVGGAALGLLSFLGGGEASVIGSAHVMVEAGLEIFSILNGNWYNSTGGFLGDSFFIISTITFAEVIYFPSCWFC